MLRRPKRRLFLLALGLLLRACLRVPLPSLLRFRLIKLPLR
jgi:hypothetical protein